VAGCVFHIHCCDNIYFYCYSSFSINKFIPDKRTVFIRLLDSVIYSVKAVLQYSFIYTDLCNVWMLISMLSVYVMI